MQEILFFLIGCSLSITGLYYTHKVIKVAVENDK